MRCITVSVLFRMVGYGWHFFVWNAGGVNTFFALPIVTVSTENAGEYVTVETSNLDLRTALVRMCGYVTLDSMITRFA